MINNFEFYSYYYDLLYSDKDYESEVDYVINMIRANTTSVGSILNLGCGSGRHDEILKRLGFSVMGIELSEKMIEIARKKNLNCVLGDITHFDLGIKFDTILSLFHVLSYLNTNQDIQRMFQCVSNHINDDGLFLFDVWFTPAVYSQKPEIRIKECENEFIKIHRLATPSIDYFRNVVEIKYDVSVYDKVEFKETLFTELHLMRHFSIPELQYHAKEHGFELLKCEEFLTSKELSDNTWGACFLFKKNGK
jgi:SAM-dependent methyltransferase